MGMGLGVHLPQMSVMQALLSKLSIVRPPEMAVMQPQEISSIENFKHGLLDKTNTQLLEEKAL